MDGDGRGGAALSMRAVTGKPIKFVGLGEKLDALEEFHPDRIAGRILGMGDIVALVEKAQETLEAEAAERMMKRFQKGQFNMNDLKGQLEQMQKMGGMQGVMGMLPGMGKMQKQMDEAGIDDRMLRRQIALINSMTKKERRNPDLLQASRKRRIAAGAGLEVQELNRLLKMHRQMADVMKKMGGMGKKGLLRGGLGALLGKGAAGMPGLPPAAACPALRRDAARPRAAARPHRARPQEMTARPDLVTERLVLRRAPAGGLRALRRASTPRSASAYIGGPLEPSAGPGPCSPPTSAPGTLRRLRDAGAVEARATARFCGQVGLNQPPHFPEPESAGSCSRASRAAAIATEAARAARGFAYAQLGWTTAGQLHRPRQPPLDRARPPPRLHRGPGRRAARPGPDPSSATRARRPLQ